jgi:hypothetical protein
MAIRPFGRRSGLMVNPLSLGAMRLPRDEAAAVALIRQAIDAGCRYIDTSRGYGDSEIKLGLALKDGYRERVILSTKWSPWVVKYAETDDSSADCVRRRLEESMRRLDVGHLDFYQVWNVDSEEHYRQAVAPGGMVDGIRRAMAEGLVSHTGFTAHDTPANLLRYLDETDWAETILLSYNALNQEYAPVLRRARELGIATVVMNPVGGGRLAEPSAPMLRLALAVGAASVPELAIRYVLANPDIDTFINGLSKPADLDGTLAALARGPLSPAAVVAVDAGVRALSAEAAGFCTGCRYCLPCPQDIDIPAIMKLIHDYRVFEFPAGSREAYRWVAQEHGPADCTGCRRCADRCTQHLDIPAELAWAGEHLVSTDPPAE